MKKFFTYASATVFLNPFRVLRISFSFFFYLLVLFACESSDGPDPAGEVPDQVTLTGSPRDGAVDLVWAAPDDGGSSITGYNVYVDGTVAEASPLPATPTAYTVTDLVNGRAYRFRVSALNAIGEGARSDSIVVTPRPADAPKPPVIRSADSQDGAVRLIWTEPADNGSPITGYNVYVDGEKTNSDPLPSTPTEYLVEGLTNGRAYRFRVSALNAIGEGARSDSITVTPRSADAPKPPVIRSADSQDGAVRLIWTEPADNGSPITGYNVYVDGTLTENSPLEAIFTSYTVTGLANGQTYGFRVAAINASGEGAPSDEVAVTPRSADAPKKPVIRSAAPQDGVVDLVWEAPDEGGSPITGYNVYVNDTIISDSPLEATSTAYTVTGLANGQTYGFRVAAINASGEGEPSDEVAATPRSADAPGKPVIRSANPQDKAVYLVWDAPEQGGSPITGYNVYVDGKKTNSEPLPSTPTEYLVEGLINGRAYGFRISAINAFGEGEPSDVHNATPASEPGKPIIIATEPRDGAVKLIWELPPALNNGFPVTSYKLYVDGEHKADIPGSRITNTTEYTVTELNNGQAYTFRVSAVNAIGEGELSGEVVVTPRSAQAPKPPLIIDFESSNGAVKLVWRKPADNGFSITGYNVYVDGTVTEASPLSATTTAYTVRGLTNERAYAFRVSAVNEKGEGELSDEVKVTPSTSSTATSSSVVGDFEDVVQKGSIPSDKSSYSSRGQELLRLYQDGASVTARYVAVGGRGAKDGSSEENAAAQLKTVLDGIGDASSDKVYVVFVEAGVYDAGQQMAMKSHVAIVARTGVALSGGDSHRVFNNTGIDDTALLFGATITKGIARTGNGGGMANGASSPTLYDVAFTDNLATGGQGAGGGMYNGNNSSPTLYGVTFKNNRSRGSVARGGGGMCNVDSSPTLYNVAFANNTADFGGGMSSYSSSPTLYNVTFANNSASFGAGGMYNASSSSILANVTFANNTADFGGGMHNYSSSPILVNVTFANNSAGSSGGGMATNAEGSENALLLNTVFWGNTAPTGTQIAIRDAGSTSERLTLYNSLVEGGVGVVDDDDTPLKSGEATKTIKNGGIGSTHASADIIVVFEHILSEDPDLGSLAENGGAVQTLALSAGSPAKDQGLYVRKSGDDYYLSETAGSWRKLAYNSASQTWDVTANQSPPADATDLVAADARGYRRMGRPDLGAYEIGGTAP